MKNKFIKFSLLPLSVSILALSSCNPYPMKWHIISEEAGERAIKEIIRIQEKEYEEKTYKVPKLSNFNYKTILKINGNITSSLEADYQYDEDNNYLKAELNKTKGSGKYDKSIFYFVKQNNNYYRYLPLSSESTKYENYEKFKEAVDDRIYQKDGGFSMADCLRGNLIPNNTIEYLNDNVLGETIGYEGREEGYYKKSKRISEETKGNDKGYKSNFYFQMQENASIEYYEYSLAPTKYFVEYDLSKDAEKCKKVINYKFINNYLSSFSFEFVAYTSSGLETSYTSTCTIDNKVTKDHIVVPDPSI